MVSLRCLFSLINHTCIQYIQILEEHHNLLDSHFILVIWDEWSNHQNTKQLAVNQACSGHIQACMLYQIIHLRLGYDLTQSSGRQLYDEAMKMARDASPFQQLLGHEWRYIPSGVNQTHPFEDVLIYLLPIKTGRYRFHHIYLYIHN